MFQYNFHSESYSFYEERETFPFLLFKMVDQLKIVGIIILTFSFFFFLLVNLMDPDKYGKPQIITSNESTRHKFQFWTNIQVCKENQVCLICCLIFFNTLVNLRKIWHLSCFWKIWSPPPISGYSGPIDSSVNYRYQDAKSYKGPVLKGKLERNNWRLSSNWTSLKNFKNYI